MTGIRNRAQAAAKFGTLRLPNLFFPRAPADLSAQRKFVIWLANNVRETNLFSSFGYAKICSFG